ncbi:hypothetical protein QAD02_013291 [Eretmocerus hayati]|uniref:Uncharacterized protein n=1 Tax=Eretmocerus hayati TaxID=131215 RepID=A0ACC2P2G8_9HYME|nr:hypothetical protein QAD02_013291 [Eretmocerus hayati]
MLNKQGGILLREFENSVLMVLNGRRRTDCNDEMTSIGSNGSSAIDYIWTNHGGLGVLSDFSVTNIGSSDHLPVVAKMHHIAPIPIRTPDEASSSKTKYCWDRSKWVDYINHMAEQDTFDIESHDVEQLSNAVIDTIKRSASHPGLTRKFHPDANLCTRDEPWFDKECRKAYAKQTNLYHQWSRSRRSSILRKIFDTTQALGSTIRREKDRTSLTPSVTFGQCQGKPP